jgi:hypothetical protein
MQIRDGQGRMVDATAGIEVEGEPVPAKKKKKKKKTVAKKQGVPPVPEEPKEPAKREDPDERDADNLPDKWGDEDDFED